MDYPVYDLYTNPVPNLKTLGWNNFFNLMPGFLGAEVLLDGHTLLPIYSQFMSAHRKRLLLLLEENPDVELHLLFNNPNTPISKEVKKTYGEWAELNGFEFSKMSEHSRSKYEWRQTYPDGVVNYVEQTYAV
jgi:hypothetical protein